MLIEQTKDGQATAILCSAGLDSVVLLAAEARSRFVQPVYVAAGLAWESDELLALNQLLETQAFLTNVGRPVRLEATVHDVYPPSHWAIEGHAPAYDTPDSDVYLVGRNAILLSKVAVFCCQHGIGRIAIGSLANNPFPDGTPEFLEAMANALSLGLAHELSIVAPLTKHHKADVIALGIELKVPLELTLSCMQPENGLHCGLCSKCRERRDAFNEAGVPDLTDYKMPSPR
tara:strand:+ start:2207 stop:2899 length:693 start_codon:yes stop_codon:yes gene_type:complete